MYWATMVAAEQLLWCVPPPASVIGREKILLRLLLRFFVHIIECCVAKVSGIVGVLQYLPDSAFLPGLGET